MAIAAKLLPVYVSDSPRYLYNIPLDGDIFVLYFHWNSRENFWYMDILKSDGTTNILTGIKLVPNYRLLKQYKAIDGLPKGDFVLYDSEENVQDEQLTFENFGVRYKMLYFEEGAL